MPTCTQCGEYNPDGTSRCIKCGVSLGHQVRARGDAKRGQVGQAFRAVTWIAALIVLAIVGPLAYRAVGGAYFKYRLNIVSESTIKGCGGPITETTASFQKDQINKCISESTELTQAQSAYTNFTGSSKP